MHALFREIGRFRHDKSGNIAVIFVIALLPVLAAIGSAVDYSLATRMKAKLQSAADAASVASLSQKSPGYTAAAAMTSDGTVTVAVADANKVFDGNMSGVTGYTNLTRTSTVTKTGIRLNANVTFSADVPVVFMQVMGHQKMTVTGTSSASASLPPYLDFYLMLDVSGSMGLASTTNEQTRLAAVNPDDRTNYPTGCAFACHFETKDVCTNNVQQYPTNNLCLGYPVSRLNQNGFKQLLQQNGGKIPSSMLAGLPNSLYSAVTSVTSCPTDNTNDCIQLRADAVGYAVTRLFETANASAKVTNQFRIGLYPFIRYLYAYFPLTSSINGSPTNSSTINYAAANLASQLDTNMSSSLGSGGTHFENAFPAMSNLIPTVGNGTSSTNTQPFVFLVTDGAQNYQVKGINSGSWSGSNRATTLDPVAHCKPLKDRGIKISVLYIPYQPISPPNPTFAGGQDLYANANIPNIPPSLQACASPGFFYTANAPADITRALNDMFNTAVSSARITN